MILHLVLMLFTMATTMVNSLDCPNGCICSTANGLNLTVCQERQFQSIPTDISPHTNFLDLSANNLGPLRNYTFSTMKLTELRAIVLRRAGITGLAKYAFAKLKWLKELDLSENRIVTLDQFIFADNKILELVNFSSNPLLTLTSFQFAPLPRLKSLDLHSCALTNVAREAFTNLFFLETLDLRNNSLRTLPSDIFTWLPNLRSVGLSTNSWRCDCDVQMLTVSLQYRGLYTNQTCVYEEQSTPVLWHKMDNVSSACVPLIEEHMEEMLLSGVPRLHVPLALAHHHTNTSVRFSSHFITHLSSNSHSWIVALVSAILATVCLCYVIRVWAKRRRRSQNTRFDEYSYEEEMEGLRANVYRDYLDEGPSTSSGYRNENFCLLGEDDGDSDMSVSIGL